METPDWTEKWPGVGKHEIAALTYGFDELVARLKQMSRSGTDIVGMHVDALLGLAHEYGGMASEELEDPLQAASNMNLSETDLNPYFPQWNAEFSLGDIAEFAVSLAFQDIYGGILQDSGFLERVAAESAAGIK